TDVAVRIQSEEGRDRSSTLHYDGHSVPSKGGKRERGEDPTLLQEVSVFHGHAAQSANLNGSAQCLRECSSDRLKGFRNLRTIKSHLRAFVNEMRNKTQIINLLANYLIRAPKRRSATPSTRKRFRHANRTEFWKGKSAGEFHAFTHQAKRKSLEFKKLLSADARLTNKRASSVGGGRRRGSTECQGQNPGKTKRADIGEEVLKERGLFSS
ncbi:hypothetical protein SCHPADRAFT_897130, partial [Schizopora paradoxa]